MTTMVLFALLNCSMTQQQASDARGVIDTIEALQHDIKDFQCEYEGKVYYLNKEVQRSRKLGDDGLFLSFSGFYLWKQGGNTLVDSLNRSEPDGNIIRETLIMRPLEKQAESYRRPVDAAIGEAEFHDVNRYNANRSGMLGEIFLIDEIKRLALDKNLESKVDDQTLEGRLVKVLTFSTTNFKWPADRFWIDLKRTGHVVRRETYAPKGLAPEESLLGRVDIKLAPFKVNGFELWMPISGVAEGHAAIKNSRPVLEVEPTNREIIYMNEGTLNFNTKPGPEMFTHRFKVGTPISDNLRRTQYEYGLQKPPPRQSKADIEAMLRGQLAEAQKQEKELLASSPARSGPGFLAWLPWIAGGVLIVASLALLRQRTARRG